jgi:YebC/PmpR family DNA-binding regulatory protein
MAGHSKWNNIKNRKGAVDSQRAKAFSMASKAIRIAVKEGKSADPKFNPTLRLALEKAREVNMPKDKIQRAIDSGLGKRNGNQLQEVIYEAFGPGGTGLMVVSMTDNPQRTSAEIKFILSRNGGSLGSPGSAQYLFVRDNEGGYAPTMPLTLDDETVVEGLLNLIDELRQNEDVEDIYYSATWEGENIE